MLHFTCCDSFWQPAHALTDRKTSTPSTLALLFHLNYKKDNIVVKELQSDCRVLLCYLMMVGMTSAVKRMQREAVAWEEKRPSTEKIVMAVSLRSSREEESRDNLCEA